MKPRRFGRSVIFVVLLGLAAAPAAQRATPSDDNDPEFAKLVKEWTTKPEFLSPLVDHLPKKAGVPTPKDILGYHIGEPKKLTYTADQFRFFRALEKALPGRVKTMVVGKTEEGREILVVFVSSEANIADLEHNRQNMKRLADPRGLSPAEAAKIVAGDQAALSPERRSAQRRNESARVADGAGLPPRGLAKNPTSARFATTSSSRSRRRPTSTGAIAMSIGTTPTRSTSCTTAARTTAVRRTGASTSSTTTIATSTTASTRCARISTGICTGCRRSGTTCTKRRRCSTRSAVSRRRTRISIRCSTRSCRSSRRTK